ncbi:MAG: hypothetical protein JWN35_363, partial [Frankiales bacterium]|nr:hypothetical protein [Frankiales bacterium]
MPPLPRPAVLAAGGILGLLVLGYGASFAFADGDVPRGVHVAGHDLSGRTPAQARALVESRLAPQAARPLTLVAGEVRLALPPATSGLRLDVAATVADATSAGPLSRLRGLFGARRDVAPRTTVDRGVLSAALKRLALGVDRAPREGTITFRGASPVPVQPLAGRRLDVAAAADAVSRAWLRQPSVHVPVSEQKVKSSPEDVQKALTSLARPAVAAPVTVDVEGRPVTVRAADVAAGLSFTVNDDGALRQHLDGAKVLASLGRTVRAVERTPVDATFDVTSGQPVLVPGRDGRTIKAAALEKALSGVLTAPAPRRTAVGLEVTTPRVTTSRATTLGVREAIGTFTTYHPCCANRVTNIHTIAELLDGYVVLPGEVFSLNGVVGKRDAARGFRSAPQILHGQFVNDIGGGISQFTTTLFNAVFFSGLKDVQHTPHSYYISRYPPGRESTVSFPEPDFRFQNDSPNGVLIKTSYTPTSITVTFWGAKRYDVTSETGPRTRIRTFGIQYVDRPDCTSSTGAEGFDIVVTRVFSQGGRVVRREPFTTRYLPEPRFICGPVPAARPTPPSSPPSAPSPASPP